MKLTTFVTLSPKIHHTTFEKKWPCSFKDVKHVKFLTQCTTSYSDNPKYSLQHSCKNINMTNRKNTKQKIIKLALWSTQLYILILHRHFHWNKYLVIGSHHSKLLIFTIKLFDRWHYASFKIFVLNHIIQITPNIYLKQ